MTTASQTKIEMANRLFFRLYQCANMLHKTGSRAVEAEGLTTQQWAVLGALSRDKAEAASPSLFVAGWRPAIGWTCAAALAYQFLLAPLAVWVGFLIGHPVPKPPTLDEHLWELMFGMLGLGALRSLEKIKAR